MNVLFLLSSLEPAGSETYCLALAQTWKDRHQIFWISDRLHYGQTYTPLPIHQKAIPGGVINTLRVARFIKENKIQLIHSHSRRAHWVAAQAAFLTGIPHVTTIHQPPPVHFFSKLWPCLGHHTLAIDEAVEDHLRRHFGRSIRKLSLIRNGINVDAITPTTPSAGDNKILFLGRLSGGRWRAFEFFVQLLQRAGASFPPTVFQVVGRLPGRKEEDFEWLMNETNRVLQPSRIEALGFLNDLQPTIRAASAVIAGGRSALESLASGKPVIALGEKGVIGLCTEDTWALAMRSNFGDHLDSSTDSFYPAPLELGLRQIVNRSVDLPALGHWGRKQVEKYYDVKTVAAAIDAIYKELCPSS